eukprot:gene41977-56840_t
MQASSTSWSAHWLARVRGEQGGQREERLHPGARSVGDAARARQGIIARRKAGTEGAPADSSAFGNDQIEGEGGEAAGGDAGVEQGLDRGREGFDPSGMGGSARPRRPAPAAWRGL